MSDHDTAPVFVLVYRLNRDDLIAQDARFGGGDGHGRLALVLLAPPFLWGMAGGALFPALPGWAFYALALLALGLGALLTLPLMARAQARRIAGLPEILPETRLSLVDDHLLGVQDGEERLYFLADAGPPRPTAHHIFIPFRSGAVLTIPNRAFADAAERAAFEAELARARAESRD